MFRTTGTYWRTNAGSSCSLYLSFVVRALAVCNRLKVKPMVARKEDSQPDRAEVFGEPRNCPSNLRGGTGEVMLLVQSGRKRGWSSAFW